MSQSPGATALANWGDAVWGEEGSEPGGEACIRGQLVLLFARAGSRALCPIAHLANDVRRVSGALEQLWQGHLIQRQPTGSTIDERRVNTCVYPVSARHERCTRWATDWLDVVVFEFHARGSQSIQMGRVDDVCVIAILVSMI
jgi:hypothetical protein